MRSSSLLKANTLVRAASVAVTCSSLKCVRQLSVLPVISVLHLSLTQGLSMIWGFIPERGKSNEQRASPEAGAEWRGAGNYKEKRTRN